MKSEEDERKNYQAIEQNTVKKFVRPGHFIVYIPLYSTIALK